MNPKYEPLFTPWKIGNCEIKNRIVLCPMGGTSLFGWMEPNHFDKEAGEFFMLRAKNEVGLIIPGIAPLRNSLGGKWLWQSPKMFKQLKEYMTEIHKTGAKLFVQLTAGFGRAFAITDAMNMIIKHPVVAKMAKPIMDVNYLIASPSEEPSRWDESVKCRALTKKEIHDLVEGFAKTAKLCKDAGVDGVEVHAVHEGYLMDQFTLPYSNHRTDEYGGSFENRYRFPREVVEAIKKLCGKDFPVSLRYSVVSKTKGFGKGALPEEKDFVEVGRNMEESERAAKYLVDCGYDMLNADNGTYDAWYWAHPPMYMPENCNLEDVAHIRKFVDVPVVCAGRMSPEVSAEAIKNNEIDAMGVARQFLTDPEWVTKLKEDRLEDICPCICCHNGCFTMSHYKGVANSAPMDDAMHMARCALNPQTMQGHKHDIIPAKKKKNVAVIGGGIGGMEVARIATLRGHKVTIYEKSDKLGGVFIPASAMPFKEKDREYIAWERRQMEKLGVEIKFNTEVKDIKSLKADEVVVCTGSLPKLVRCPGSEKAIEACEYLNGVKEVGDKVAIIGGGLTGCEIAYDLFLKGKHPYIIEFMDDIMRVDGLCMANSSYLRDFFELHKVDIRLETGLKEIKEGKIVVAPRNGGEAYELDADSVITAVGYKSNPLVEKDSRHVHIVGDALKVGNLRTVVWRAWEVAEKL